MTQPDLSPPFQQHRIRHEPLLAFAAAALETVGQTSVASTPMACSAFPSTSKQ